MNLNNDTLFSIAITIIAVTIVIIQAVFFEHFLPVKFLSGISFNPIMTFEVGTAFSFYRKGNIYSETLRSLQLASDSAVIKVWHFIGPKSSVPAY